ncbi:MAG: hypothetical protein ACRD2B_13990 [Terriglobia bacterium]
MNWKRFAPLIILCVAAALVGYLFITPPKVTGASCCVFPTQEQETAYGPGTGNQATVAAFKMVLSDRAGH